MFAGKAVADDVAKHLDRVGNVVNMERNAYDSYDDLDWGIEAVEEGGKVWFHSCPAVIADLLVDYIVQIHLSNDLESHQAFPCPGVLCAEGWR